MPILPVATIVTGNERTDIRVATVGQSANGTVIEAPLAGTPGAMTMKDQIDEIGMVLMIAAVVVVVVVEEETDGMMVALQGSKKLAEAQAPPNHESPLRT